jgi:hypothetical protein
MGCVVEWRRLSATCSGCDTSLTEQLLTAHNQISNQDLRRNSKRRKNSHNGVSETCWTCSVYNDRATNKDRYARNSSWLGASAPQQAAYICADFLSPIHYPLAVARRTIHSSKWKVTQWKSVSASPFLGTYLESTAQAILDECFARLLQLRIRLLIGDFHEPFS